MGANWQALPPLHLDGGNAALGGVVLSGSSKVTQLNTYDMADKNRVWMRQKDFDDLDQDAGWCNVYSYEPAPPSREATLVVHEGKAERVFTESEVRAMLEDMRNDPLTDELQRSGVIEPIAAKHGIALDPV